MNMLIKVFKAGKGFTLIELIVVLIILGITTAMALPSYFSWVQRCNSAEAITNLNSIKPQVELCLDAHLTQEGLCDPMSANFANTPNFIYSWSITPGNSFGIPPVSGAVTAVRATSLNNAADFIDFIRNSSGVWNCYTYGIYMGIC